MHGQTGLRRKEGVPPVPDKQDTLRQKNKAWSHLLRSHPARQIRYQQPEKMSPFRRGGVYVSYDGRVPLPR